MSLMRRIAWLLVLMLTLALGGALLVSGGALRELLAQQASIKNADNAQALALAASQQGGDAALIELLMSAQFDTGHYQMLRWTRVDGRVAFERQSAQQGGRHPAWLPRWVPIQAEPGLAQLSSGWQQLGKVELASQLSYAYDALWTSLLRVASYALPDAYTPADKRREMRLVRYANDRINRVVNAEDTWLIERVQRGMESASYTAGPIGRSEVCLRNFAGRIRDVIPEARLHRAPAAGWSKVG